MYTKTTKGFDSSFKMEVVGVCTMKEVAAAVDAAFMCLFPADTMGEFYGSFLFNEQKETISLLLEKDADVNAKDSYGDTPLHKACYYEHKAIISLLLENGANVNAKSDNGETLLHWAIRHGLKAVISLLLENGANVNVKDNDGDTPLHKAYYYGYKAIVSLLLEKRADMNAKGNSGWTPLHVASKEGNEDIVSCCWKRAPIETLPMMMARLLCKLLKKMTNKIVPLSFFKTKLQI
jgi:hypothetical protein